MAYKRNVYKHDCDKVCDNCLGMYIHVQEAMITQAQNILLLSVITHQIPVLFFYVFRSEPIRRSQSSRAADGIKQEKSEYHWEKESIAGIGI